MVNTVRQMLMGLSSIFLAPSGRLPRPAQHITLPPENASQAIGFDFSNISRDLSRAVDKVKNQKQLEFELK